MLTLDVDGGAAHRCAVIPMSMSMKENKGNLIRWRLLEMANSAEAARRRTKETVAECVLLVVGARRLVWRVLYCML